MLFFIHLQVSAVKPQESSPLADNNSQTSDASQWASQVASAKGNHFNSSDFSDLSRVWGSFHNLHLLISFLLLCELFAVHGLNILAYLGACIRRCRLDILVIGLHALVLILLLQV